VRSLNEYFSINAITEKLLLLVKRFPISVLLLAVTEYYNETLFLSGDFFSGRSDLFIQTYLFLTLGVFISAVAALWSEDIVDYGKQCVITAAILLLWGGYCFFLLKPLSHQDYTAYAEPAAIGLAVLLSIYFISFLKKDTDKAFWNFTVRTTFQYTLATCFGIIIFAGLSGAFYAVGALFNLDIPGTVFKRLASICLILFTQIYFLANIPDKNAKHSEDMRLSKPMKALGLYVLAPLVAVYAVILYVYLFKIILSMELPKGFVSWLVSSLACVGFFTVGILYPARLEEKNKAVVYMSRYFGLAMLPLLALMTVGIIRRVSDYGITIFRGYLIVINIWLYGVCIYHFITKAKRIKWIFISFTAVALLSSIRFCGLPDVTRYILTAEVRGYISDNKISVADKDTAGITPFFDKLGPENRKKIAEKMEYLRETYGFESVKAFFESDVTEKDAKYIENLWEYNKSFAEQIAQYNDDWKTLSVYNYWRNKTWNVTGYNSFAYIEHPNNSDHEKIRSSFKDHELTVVCNPAGAKEKSFNISLVKIIRPLANDTTPEMYLKGDGYTLLIDRFEGRYCKSADSVGLRLRLLCGYLFYNE
jgi:hypothetical protein